MIKYLMLNQKDIKEETIDNAYIDLLKSGDSFGIISMSDKNYILTKEKSLFIVDDLNKFIEVANEDIYFKTVYCNEEEYLKDDLNLYYKYINNYKNQMIKVYGDKYIFGGVAIKTINNNVITTTRGKENFNDYTIVTAVDFDNNVVYVKEKKATLNAPLIYNLLKNKNIKAIVHINHKYDNRLPFLPYAFPGTVKDSLRDISKSFNISHHGLFMLFDNNEKMIRSDV